MSFTGEYGIWQQGCFFEKLGDIHKAGSANWIYALLGCVAIGYLFGSINCGILISKIFGRDVRKSGSGNAGTTNMIRTFGKKAGIITFIGDFLKATVALILCRIVFGVEGAFIGGIACILGHAYPLYFGFKGGKGVVCIAAMGLFTDPLSLAIMLVIFTAILLGFKMVSFASVMSMLIYPFIISFIYGPGIWFIYALIAAAIVIFLHRKNIVRIFNHTESKIGQKKKK